jgi:hypothetical protein
LAPRLFVKSLILLVFMENPDCAASLRLAPHRAFAYTPPLKDGCGRWTPSFEGLRIVRLSGEPKRRRVSDPFLLRTEEKDRTWLFTSIS